MTGELSDEDFETAYDLLAAAIDRAGVQTESVFLARLCLLLARRAGTLAQFEQAIASAEHAGSADRGGAA